MSLYEKVKSAVKKKLTVGLSSIALALTLSQPIQAYADNGRNVPEKVQDKKDEKKTPPPKEKNETTVTIGGLAGVNLSLPRGFDLGLTGVKRGEFRFGYFDLRPGSEAYAFRR